MLAAIQTERLERHGYAGNGDVETRGFSTSSISRYQTIVWRTRAELPQQPTSNVMALASTQHAVRLQEKNKNRQQYSYI